MDSGELPSYLIEVYLSNITKTEAKTKTRK